MRCDHPRGARGSRPAIRHGRPPGRRRQVRRPSACPSVYSLVRLATYDADIHMRTVRRELTTCVITAGFAARRATIIVRDGFGFVRDRLMSRTVEHSIRWFFRTGDLFRNVRRRASARCRTIDDTSDWLHGSASLRPPVPGLCRPEADKFNWRNHADGWISSGLVVRRALRFYLRAPVGLRRLPPSPVWLRDDLPVVRMAARGTSCVCNEAGNDI